MNQCFKVLVITAHGEREIAKTTSGRAAIAESRNQKTNLAVIICGARNRRITVAKQIEIAKRLNIKTAA